MKITLVRHAETEQNILDLCQGRQNNQLSDNGRTKCKLLKAQLKDIKFDYCYMSPMLRAVETAIILIGDRVETFPDNRLIERELGEFEGMPRKFYDPKKYWDYNLNSSDRGVEPVQDIFKRAKSFLDYVKEKNKGQHIIVVSHGSPIRALRHLILNTDLNSNLIDCNIPNLYCETFEIEE